MSLKSIYDKAAGRHPSFKRLAQRASFPFIDALCQAKGYHFPRGYPRWDRLTATLGFHGDNEAQDFRTYQRVIREGDTILDVGANIGIHSRILAGLAGPLGRVFAFEPTPELFTCLEKNTTSFGTCTCIPKAVYSKKATLQFGIHSHSCTSNALLTQGADTIATITVDATSLDSWVVESGITEVHFVKIDVEGAECEVLAGASQLVADHPQIVLMIEYCPSNLARFDVSPSDYHNRIRELGLECFHHDAATRIEKLDTVGKLESIRGSRPFINILAMRPESISRFHDPIEILLPKG